MTDITNFFDSVVYTQLEATLFELGIQRNVVGLLFLILERLSIRDAYSALPRIGLPVDEFDCSRCLAHAVLFPHDDRMVGLVGEAAYVRWMDDQTFGVKSEAGAYAALAQVNASLRRMHLVANAGKTQILTLAQARRYFHFDINDVLDRVEKLCNQGTFVGHELSFVTCGAGRSPTSGTGSGTRLSSGSISTRDESVCAFWCVAPMKTFFTIRPWRSGLHGTFAWSARRRSSFNAPRGSSQIPASFTTTSDERWGRSCSASRRLHQPTSRSSGTSPQAHWGEGTERAPSRPKWRPSFSCASATGARGERSGESWCAPPTHRRHAP